MWYKKFLSSISSPDEVNSDFRQGRIIEDLNSPLYGSEMLLQRKRGEKVNVGQSMIVWQEQILTFERTLKSGDASQGVFVTVAVLIEYAALNIQSFHFSLSQGRFFPLNGV